MIRIIPAKWSPFWRRSNTAMAIMLMAIVAYVYVTGTPSTVMAESAPYNNKRTDWWAFQSRTQPAVPAVKNTSWPTNEIDQFILARLESEGLAPNAAADRTALMRRAYYDLIGLPPSPEDAAAFLADTSPDAYEKLIDRLLAMPQYGERWGRHWLDLVRYAETNGYERDGDKPNVWRYRDYVINAFNQDKPYDQFVREQIAGDELNEVTDESVIATGYYRLGLWDDEPVEEKEALFDDLDDVVMTTSQVFLGMTINCARCHDHKIDPILQADYYRLLAFFRNVRRFSHNRGVSSDFSQRPIKGNAEEQSADTVARKDRREQVEAKLAELEAVVEKTFSNPEKEDAVAPAVRKALIEQKRNDVLDKGQNKEYDNLSKGLKNLGKPSTFTALSVTEHGRDVPPTYVLLRGNAHAEGDEVQPGFPAALRYDDPKIEPIKNVKSSGRRRVLADWIVRKDNPMTARVMANRLWQYHFGRGIVRSSNDFGQIGTPPTHPQLLDWLANELVAGDWHLKRMHKLIMLSRTYRMSSAANKDALLRDPQNDLFWRFDMRRLSAEELRDSILAVNGTLNLKMGGPSIFPPLPEAVLATASRPEAAWGHSSPEDAARRSIYIKVKRSLRHPMMEGFDGADTDATCPVRFTTTVPTQSLTLLNSEFSSKHAKLLADRLRRDHPNKVAEQIRNAAFLTSSRTPTEDEIQKDIEFITAMQNEEGMTPEQALDHYCLMILNTNAFIYLD